MRSRRLYMRVLTMASEPLSSSSQPDARERDARIDQMLADIEQKLATVIKIKQETRLAPWQVFGTMLGAGAAFFAAGAAVMKLIIG
jgi:hypothetical protein